MSAQRAISPPVRKTRLAISIFSLAVVAMLVAAVILALWLMTQGGGYAYWYTWVMLLLGAAVITTMITAVFIPYMKGEGH